jgi:uncharacterized protein (TIGR04255 family)
MPYANKHLAEVICSFEFIEDIPKWDSIYFGSYFEMIRSSGFSERQERKGVLATLPTATVAGHSLPFPVAVDQMVFKHPVRNWGIIMSKRSISFHVLISYVGWNCFRDELIRPFYKQYLELGLGIGQRNCTMMYLNRFERKREELLSDYYSIASPIDKAFGFEKNTILQRLFEKKENLFLVTKLTTQDQSSEQYAVNLECGAISVKRDMPWAEQIEEVHAPILQFFETIITERQRTQL